MSRRPARPRWVRSSSPRRRRPFPVTRMPASLSSTAESSNLAGRISNRSRRGASAVSPGRARLRGGTGGLLRSRPSLSRSRLALRRSSQGEPPWCEPPRKRPRCSPSSTLRSICVVPILPTSNPRRNSIRASRWWWSTAGSSISRTASWMWRGCGLRFATRPARRSMRGPHSPRPRCWGRAIRCRSGLAWPRRYQARPDGGTSLSGGRRWPKF